MAQLVKKKQTIHVVTKFDNFEKCLSKQSVFGKFLLSNNIYNQFISNIRNYGLIDISNFCTLSPLGYITNAFDWVRTNEGEDFWLNMSRVWVKRYRSLVK